MQYVVPFGTAAWMWGTVFIDRGSRSAHDALKIQARAVKEEKVNNLLMWSRTNIFNPGNYLLLESGYYLWNATTQQLKLNFRLVELELYRRLT